MVGRLGNRARSGRRRLFLAVPTTYGGLGPGVMLRREGVRVEGRALAG